MSSAALHSHLPDSAGGDQHPLSDFDLLGKHKEATKFLYPELNLLEFGALLQFLLAHCRWGKMSDRWNCTDRKMWVRIGPHNSQLHWSENVFSELFKWCLIRLNWLWCLKNYFPVGSVWTYPVYPPNYRSGPLYCQRTTYKLAFAVTTLLWVTVGLVFACGLCCVFMNRRENAVPTERLMPSQKTSYGSTRNEPTAGDVWLQFLSSCVRKKNFGNVLKQ